MRACGPASNCLRFTAGPWPPAPLERLQRPSRAVPHYDRPLAEADLSPQGGTPTSVRTQAADDQLCMPARPPPDESLGALNPVELDGHNLAPHNAVTKVKTGHRSHWHIRPTHYSDKSEAKPGGRAHLCAAACPGLSLRKVYYSACCNAGRPRT